MEKSRELNAKEREIIRVLHKKGGVMSAHEIAKETGFSYITVTKYMERLLKRGVVIEHGTEKNKQYKDKKKQDEKV